MTPNKVFISDFVLVFFICTCVCVSQGNLKYYILESWSLVDQKLIC